MVNVFYADYSHINCHTHNTILNDLALYFTNVKNSAMASFAAVIITYRKQRLWQLEWKFPAIDHCKWLWFILLASLLPFVPCHILLASFQPSLFARNLCLCMLQYIHVVLDVDEFLSMRVCQSASWLALNVTIDAPISLWCCWCWRHL